MKTQTKKYVLELESKGLRLFENIEEIANYYELSTEEIERSMVAKEEEGILFHSFGGFIKVYDNFPTEGLSVKAMFIYKASDNQLLEVLPLNDYTFIYINAEYTEQMDNLSLKRIKESIDVDEIRKQSVIIGGNLYNIFINPEYTFRGQMKTN